MEHHNGSAELRAYFSRILDMFRPEEEVDELDIGGNPSTNMGIPSGYLT